MTKIDVLKGLGCLHKASADHFQGELRIAYNWQEMNPLVWSFYLFFLLRAFCRGLFNILRAPTAAFWSKIFYERIPSCEVGPPQLGEWYYYPYFNGTDFIPETKRFSASENDLARFHNDTCCRTLESCRQLCHQFNTLLKRKTYSK